MKNLKCLYINIYSLDRRFVYDAKSSNTESGADKSSVDGTRFAAKVEKLPASGVAEGGQTKEQKEALAREEAKRKATETAQKGKLPFTPRIPEWAKDKPDLTIVQVIKKATEATG